MIKTNAERWWDGKRPLSGVFEGGGAKGLAYAGALQAVTDAGCWFTAVAGASAGAITAAMVASGLAPEEIAKLTPVALSKLRLRPVFRGLLRLRRTSGYLDISELREWLTELVEGQYQKLTGSLWRGSQAYKIAALHQSGSDSVTFSALFKASGIELNVVAADLTARQQIVFNAVNTPYCSVVDAVLASSAIPGVFENANLVIDGRIHTVVDGGVWSNFPMFVFSESYRKFSYEQWISQLPSFLPPKKELVARLLPYMESLDSPSVSAEDIADAMLARQDEDRAGLEPNAPDLVVGFTLEEERVEGGHLESLTTRLSVHFAGPSSFMDSLYTTPPAEWEATPDDGTSSADGPKRSASRKLFWWLLAPLRWVSFLVLRYSPGMISELIRAFHPEFKGRWPEPSSHTGRWWIRWFDDIAECLYPIMNVVIVWLALAVTAGLGLSQLAEMAERSFVAMLMHLIAFLTVASTAILSLLAFLAISFGLRAVRRVGYGLVRTYVAGTGAPPWSGYAPNEYVIRLPISHSVTTLSFDVSDVRRQAVVEDAYKKTAQELTKILAEKRPHEAGE